MADPHEVRRRRKRERRRLLVRARLTAARRTAQGQPKARRRGGQPEPWAMPARQPQPDLGVGAALGAFLALLRGRRGA